MKLLKTQVVALRGELETLLKARSGEAHAYAAEFAEYAANYVFVELADPSDASLDRLRSQLLAVTETTVEIADQAAREAAVRVVIDSVRLLFAVAASAA